MQTTKAKRHYEEIDREIDKALSKFSQYLMSKSKWVRLINKFVENSNKIKKIEFKKIQKDQIGELYLNEDTTFGFDYWKNGFEGHNSLGRWLTFKEIEYLIFPKIVNDEQSIKQDLKAIVEIINGVGQFSLEVDDTKLKLICYRE